MTTKTLVIVAAAAALVAGSHSAYAGETFDAVKARGYVQCGVNTALAGFSAPDSEGNWTGLDVDTCRAISAAMFGDAQANRFTPLSAQQRFTALQSGEIDVLMRNTTWTLTRDTALGLNFAGVTFYDGQGFMIPSDYGVTSAYELEGATICVQPGTTTELNLADFFRANGMEFQPVVIEKLSEVTGAYFSGRCDVYTTDSSGLAATRAVAADPSAHMILPELISKEPLGPVVRHGDDQWFDVVKWTVFAMIEAEEKGVTSANVDEMLSSTDPTIQRLLGESGSMGANLGLDPRWAYNIIKQVGNYGEVFERNVGPDTPLGLSRGLNALWTKGGLMYAMPIR